MHPLLSDPWFVARLDAALAPHRHRLTTRQEAALRQKIAWTFSTHPAARRVLLRERPSLGAKIGAPPLSEAERDTPSIPGTSWNSAPLARLASKK